MENQPEDSARAIFLCIPPEILGPCIYDRLISYRDKAAWRKADAFVFRNTPAPRYARKWWRWINNRTPELYVSIKSCQTFTIRPDDIRRTIQYADDAFWGIHLPMNDALITFGDMFKLIAEAAAAGGQINVIKHIFDIQSTHLINDFTLLFDWLVKLAHVCLCNGHVDAACTLSEYTQNPNLVLQRERRIPNMTEWYISHLKHIPTQSALPILYIKSPVDYLVRYKNNLNPDMHEFISCFYELKTPPIILTPFTVSPHARRPTLWVDNRTTRTFYYACAKHGWLHHVSQIAPHWKTDIIPIILTTGSSAATLRWFEKHRPDLIFAYFRPHRMSVERRRRIINMAMRLAMPDILTWLKEKNILDLKRHGNMLREHAINCEYEMTLQWLDEQTPY